MASSHKVLVASYLGIVSVVSATLGGFVACGAQTYRVPIHGNEPEGGTNPSSNIQAASNLEGVHSSSGWQKHLPIHFKTSNEIPDDVVKELRKAMHTWELAVGKQLFVYDGIEQKKGADFKSLYAPLDDTVNGHYFDFNWSTATGKSWTVLATTIWENDTVDPTSISKADIRYNLENYIFGDTINQYSEGSRTIVDMESLALHELGHLLGLKHIDESEDRYSVMNPSLYIGEGMTTRRLSYQDIARIRKVYPGGDVAMAEQIEKADDYATGGSAPSE